MADRPSEVRYTPINITAVGAGVTPLIVGAAGFDIVLINASIMSDAAIDVSFEDANTTNRLGPYPVGVAGGLVLPDSNMGHTRTGSGQGLSVRLSGAASVGGGVAYRLFPTGMEIG